MKISAKHTLIILIVFWLCLVGFCSFEAKAEEYAVQSTWQMDFSQQIANAWDLFNEEIDRDFTDMGIVNAQRNLEKRINFILSQYDFDAMLYEEGRAETEELRQLELSHF